MTPLQFGIPGGLELFILIFFIAIPAAALYYWGKSRGQSEAMKFQGNGNSEEDE